MSEQEIYPSLDVQTVKFLACINIHSLYKEGLLITTCTSAFANDKQWHNISLNMQVEGDG